MWVRPVHASSTASSTADDHLASPSTVTTMFVVSAAPSMLWGSQFSLASLECLTVALSRPPRQTLPFRLWRRGSRTCPARHGACPAPRLAQGHRCRPWGHQAWPGGGWRRPWRACGRRASFLNYHVHTTHATRQALEAGSRIARGVLTGFRDVKRFKSSRLCFVL